MFYRIVKLSASLEESTIFQSPDWAATGFEYGELIKYLTKEDYLGSGEFQGYVKNGFTHNAEKYYVETFEHPDQAHYVEGFVNKQSHAHMDWGTWYSLAYFNRDEIVEAFIGSVNVTPHEHDPTGESWGE